MDPRSIIYTDEEASNEVTERHNEDENCKAITVVVEAEHENHRKYICAEETTDPVKKTNVKKTGTVIRAGPPKESCTSVDTSCRYGPEAHGAGRKVGI